MARKVLHILQQLHCTELVCNYSLQYCHLQCQYGDLEENQNNFVTVSWSLARTINEVYMFVLTDTQRLSMFNFTSKPWFTFSILEWKRKYLHKDHILLNSLITVLWYCYNTIKRFPRMASEKCTKIIFKRNTSFSHLAYVLWKCSTLTHFLSQYITFTPKFTVHAHPVGAIWKGKSFRHLARLSLTFGFTNIYPIC